MAVKIGSKRVLFVAHEATRTGAPLALLDFLRWFKKELEWPMAILIGDPGELIPEFERLAPTAIVNCGIWRRDGRLGRAMRVCGFERARNRWHASSIPSIYKKPFDLVYCNSTASGSVLRLLPRETPPILTHVHELSFARRVVIGNSTGEVLARSRRFVACSEAVRSSLELDAGVRPADIDVVYGCVSHSVLSSQLDRASAGKRLRQELGLSEHVAIVGAAGTPCWHKGTDLFAQLAYTVKRKAPEQHIHFVWLGGNANSRELEQFKYDLNQADVAEMVTHIVHAPDVARYLSGFDLFVLPSREDSFPLVCIESAACGTPVVCFDRGGGAPEFVSNRYGAVVPYLDVGLMADKTLELLRNVQMRSAMGAAASVYVRAQHTMSTAGPKIVAAMHRTLAN